MTLGLATLSAFAQEPISIESVATRYLRAETYCDSGRWGRREDPKHGFTQAAFSRCAHRDGRLKYVEHIDQPRKVVDWSDGEKYFRYSEYSSLYKEWGLDDPFLYGLYRNRNETFPVFVFRPFTRDPGRLVDPGERTRYLQSYKLNPALSDTKHSVFERFDDEHRRNAERLWVLNADKSIVRYEGLSDQAILRFADVSSHEFDRPLTGADLSYDVSPFSRYSLENNPLVFVAGLFVAAAAAGCAVWGWLFVRTTDLEALLDGRRRLWRVQLWSLGAIVLALAGLAALTLSGHDSGHPPAIVLVYVIAYWCAIAFGLAATFTVASYPAQLLSRVRSGDQPNP